ncbi:MAG TPA: class I SAM-dependent methyltransferase [Longimicrobium sp.]|nr:class I SAM-dependent methyltransferase [Longimicrobium sp.]
MTSSSSPHPGGAAGARHAGYQPVHACWVCGAADLRPSFTARFEFDNFAAQDAELAAYTGATVEMARCARCGFGQPRDLPTLPGYWERMYDQRWSEEWMARDAASPYKDLIFRVVLEGLERRVPAGARTLLDVGAHVGRLISTAAARGWAAEGVELNPASAAFAARATGLPVHRIDARELSARGRRFGAATLIDVLEHIPTPVAVLENVRAALAPGGWLAVKVPHGAAQLLKENVRARLRPGYRATVADNLIHVNQFGPRSLALALERAGFAEVSVHAAPPELIPPESGGRARVAVNAARRATWAAARLLPPASPLALHLLAFARSPG